jgi:hypothetical protein
MGALVVKNSQTLKIRIRATPTTIRAIVSGDDPTDKENLLGITNANQISYRSQEVSELLNPTKSKTTPATMMMRPTKSNCAACSRKVLPLCGLRLRKKNRRAAATPPVGLD